jgi:hypothetical protein
MNVFRVTCLGLGFVVVGVAWGSTAAEPGRPVWVDGPAFVIAEDAVMAVEAAPLVGNESDAFRVARQSALGQIALYAAARVQVQVTTKASTESRDGLQSTSEAVSESSSSSSQVNLRATQCPDRYVDRAAEVVFARCTLDKTKLAEHLATELAARRSAIDGNLGDVPRLLAESRVGAALRALRAAELAASSPIDRSTSALLNAYLPDRAAELLGGGGIDAETLARRRREVIRDLRGTASVAELSGDTGRSIAPFRFMLSSKDKRVLDIVPEAEAVNGMRAVVRPAEDGTCEVSIASAGKPTEGRGHASLRFRLPAALDESRSVVLEIPVIVKPVALRARLVTAGDSSLQRAVHDGLASVLGDNGMELVVDSGTVPESTKMSTAAVDPEAEAFDRLAGLADVVIVPKINEPTVTMVGRNSSGSTLAEIRIVLDLYSVSRRARVRSVELRVSAMEGDAEASIRACERRIPRVLAKKQGDIVNAVLKAAGFE